MSSPNATPAGAAAAPVSRIRNLSLNTPRLDAMVNHYTTVLGLTVAEGTGNAASLTCLDGATGIELIPAETASLDHLAFDLHVGIELDATARALEGAGFTPTEAQTAAGGHSVRLLDPDGAVIALLEHEPTRRSEPGVLSTHTGTGVQPFKLGHVASRVEKLDQVVDFYGTAMGFRYSDALGDDFVFMRCNADHHAVNFLRVGAPRKVHHFAFELNDWDHIKRAADELWSHNVPLIWGPGRHGPGHNLYTYHRDPDGNIVEMFAELDRMSDEGLGVFDWRPWHDGPQHPRKWLMGQTTTDPWGSVPPSDFML